MQLQPQVRLILIDGIVTIKADMGHIVPVPGHCAAFTIVRTMPYPYIQGRELFRHITTNNVHLAMASNGCIKD